MKENIKRRDLENFNGVNFSGKTFSYHEFEECIFEKCDLSQSVFKNCSFNDCRFVDSNLSNFQATYSRFSGNLFEGCKIIGVDWTKAFWDDFALSIPLKFYRCNLSDS